MLGLTLEQTLLPEHRTVRRYVWKGFPLPNWILKIIMWVPSNLLVCECHGDFGIGYLAIHIISISLEIGLRIFCRQMALMNHDLYGILATRNPLRTNCDWNLPILSIRSSSWYQQDIKASRHNKWRWGGKAKHRTSADCGFWRLDVDGETGVHQGNNVGA